MDSQREVMWSQVQLWRPPQTASERIIAAGGEAEQIYLSYPCKSTNHVGSIRRGWFQDVHQYVGMGFNRQDLQAMKVMCDEQQGLFEWKPHIYACLARRTWRHQEMRNKQLNMVAYLLELFYDLCLSPLDNVSESPGFELPMCIH